MFVSAAPFPLATMVTRRVFSAATLFVALSAQLYVNVYVPGLDERYMAAGLRKAPLCKLFAHHGILV